MMESVVLVCLAGLIIGTYTDLKTREVPDWLNYGLIFCGFGIAIINSLVYSEWVFFFNSIIGFGVFFIIAYVMYYTGQWGGGDSKMIMGLGALVGLSWPPGWLSLDSLMNGLPFLVTFFILTIIVGAIYGLVWSTALAAMNRKRFIAEFKKKNIEKKNILIKRILAAAAALILIASFFLDAPIKILALSSVIISVFTFYMLIYIKTIEKVCMLKLVPPEKLTVGDWIAKEIKTGRKVICGPKDLGIEKEQIEQLIKLKEKGKLDRVLVKEGIPFVPSFLIAFLLTLAFGSNIFFFFL